MKNKKRFLFLILGIVLITLSLLIQPYMSEHENVQSFLLGVGAVACFLGILARLKRS